MLTEMVSDAKDFSTTFRVPSTDEPHASEIRWHCEREARRELGKTLLEYLRARDPEVRSGVQYREAVNDGELSETFTATVYSVGN